MLHITDFVLLTDMFRTAGFTSKSPYVENEAEYKFIGLSFAHCYSYPIYANTHDSFMYMYMITN